MQASNFGAWQLATSRWVDLLDAAPGKEASVCYGWKKAVMEEHVDVSLLLQGTKPLTMSSVAAPSRHSPGTVSHVDSPPRVDEYAVAMQAAKRLAVRAAPPIPPGPRWLQRRAGCVQGACLPLEARCESSASIHTSPARGPLLTGDPHVPVHVQKLFYSRRSAKAKANAIRSSHFHRRACHFRLKRTECYRAARHNGTRGCPLGLA